MMSGALGAASAVLGLILGMVILLGAVQMKNLKSYTFAMISSVVAMLPFTCCCVIGLPIGIWALIVLMKPEVKAVFQG